jgi:hypothetical protein
LRGGRFGLTRPKKVVRVYSLRKRSALPKGGEGGPRSVQYQDPVGWELGNRIERWELGRSEEHGG